MYRGKFRPPPLVLPHLDGDVSEESCPRVPGGVPKTSDQSNGRVTDRPRKEDLLNPNEQSRAPRTQTNSDQPRTNETAGGVNPIAWRQKVRSLKTHRMMSADQLLRLSLNAKTVVHGETHTSKKENSDAGDRPILSRHQPLCELSKEVSESPGDVGQSGEMCEFPDLVRDHTARMNAGHSPCDEENGDIFKINRVIKVVGKKTESEEEEEEEQLENKPLLHNKMNVCITKGTDEPKNNREISSDTTSKRRSVRCLSRSAAFENEIIDKASKRRSVRRLSRSAAVEKKHIDEERSSPSTAFSYPTSPKTRHKFKVENSAVLGARAKRLPSKSLSFPLRPPLDPRVSLVRRKTLGYIESRSRGGICLICNEWVGVHHSPHSVPPRRANSSEFPIPDNSLGSAPCTPGQHSPSSPVTPHIVVSEDGGEDYPDGGGGGNGEDFGDAELNMDNSEDFGGRTSRKLSRSTEDLTTGSKGELMTKIQMTPDLSQNARHNSISSYLAPEVELSLQRKTRRNSMIGMIHRAASVNNLNLSPQQQQHLARVASTGNLRHGASKSSLSPSNGDWRREGNDSMIACLSALYGKILVVMGLAFPIGEFISGEMPLYIYKGFYLYLHLGSIAFLIYAYMFLLQVVPLPKVELKSRLQNFNKSRSGGARGPDVERGVGVGGDDSRSVTTLATFQNSKNYTITESTHESMYLKMGAMVFGIGSMIYSGLEVGQYFDLKSTAECADILLVISPVSRMLFTFIQMYFIFLNSRVAINKHRTIARFGLMHMIATNLCIWLNVLVEETKHEIHSLTHSSGHGGEHRSTKEYDELYGHGLGTVIAQIADTALRNGTAMLASSLHSPMRGSHDFGFIPAETGHHIMRRGADYAAEHPSSMYDCRKSDMMSRLVDNASPFLFPCTIEYSLLCSGVLYVIWKNINKSENNIGGERDSDISTFIARKARHHYSVDCAHATRGLFMGILVLVLTIISLILFFVLINNENTKSVAVLEANIIELSVYSVAILTVIIGMIQMRELEFVEDGDIELDNILLLIAQTGTYIYTCFTIIGGNFSLDSGRILPFFTAVITLIQTTLQTLFILNASRRCCYTYDQLTRKPGREMVTFLLICNLAMWAISTFETSRADAHPTQLNYYGVWAWTIISHVSMPLAIFYRFHVTVCLCEIWKRSYKLKHDFL